MLRLSVQIISCRRALLRSVWDMEKNLNFGIGVDIEDIERFRSFDTHGRETLLNKIFTKSELEYCFSKRNATSHLAVRYAAKEAVMKALSAAGLEHVQFREIEIVFSERGVPLVKLE